MVSNRKERARQRRDRQMMRVARELFAAAQRDLEDRVGWDEERRRQEGAAPICFFGTGSVGNFGRGGDLLSVPTKQIQYALAQAGFAVIMMGVRTTRRLAIKRMGVRKLSFSTLIQISLSILAY